MNPAKYVLGFLASVVLVLSGIVATLFLDTHDRHKLIDLSHSEARRAESMEVLFNDLTLRMTLVNQHLVQSNRELVGMRELIQATSEHIGECHQLLEAAGIPIPNHDLTPPVLEIEINPFIPFAPGEREEHSILKRN